MNEWEIGSIVLHPQLGSGTIIALSADRVEVKFKLRGTKALALAEAKEVLVLARATRTQGNSAPREPASAVPRPHVPKPKRLRPNIEATTIRCSKCGRKVPLRNASLHAELRGGLYPHTDRSRKAKRGGRKAEPTLRSTAKSRGPLFTKKKNWKRPSQEPRISGRCPAHDNPPDPRGSNNDS